MELNESELDTLRQWYNSIYDTHREYLVPSDVILYVKIIDRLDEIKRRLVGWGETSD